MEERVPLMEQSRSNPMTDEPESPAVYGCSMCLRMFSADTYYFDAAHGGYNFCVGCGEPGLEYLGVLPMVMEEDDKFFLIGEEEGVVTGPYDTQKDAQADVWGWFYRRDSNGEDTTKGRRKGHLRLAAFEGIILKEDDQKEGSSKEGPQERSQGEEDQTPSS